MADVPLDPSFYSTFFRCPTVLVNGVPLPIRNIFNFITDLSPDSPTVEDNPVDQRTEIPLTGFIGTVPGGAVGSMQYHGVDGSVPIFKGSSKILVVDADGNVEHSGAPLHAEDYADFIDGSEASRARSQWMVGHTTNATPTVVGDITLPAGTFGDCAIFVQVRSPYAYVSSGTTIACGILVKEAAFKRESGTLTRIGIIDTSPDGLSSGTQPGGLDVDVHTNDTIKVVATGIIAKNITTQTSIHVQLVKP
jgi:hypothetical protein